jgi:hypothetical protein
MTTTPSAGGLTNACRHPRHTTYVSPRSPGLDGGSEHGNCPAFPHAVKEDMRRKSQYSLILTPPMACTDVSIPTPLVIKKAIAELESHQPRDGYYLALRDPSPEGVARAARELTKDLALRSALSAMAGQTKPAGEWYDGSALAATVEVYVRYLLSECAYRVMQPAFERNALAAPAKLRRLLPRSMGQRTRFLDTKGRLWRDVLKYMAPLRHDLAAHRRGPSCMYVAALNDSAWGFYMLALAARNHSDVLLSAAEVIKATEVLLSYDGICSESKTRLAIIKGIFALYRATADVPVLACCAGSGTPLIERVDEILEDAHLLEASHVRRFLGLGSNVATVRRRLRQVLTFITKHRKWATGVVSLGSQTAAIVHPRAALLAKLADLVPDIGHDPVAPVLYEPEYGLLGLGGLLVESRREAMHGRWSMLIANASTSQRSRLGPGSCHCLESARNENEKNEG